MRHTEKANLDISSVTAKSVNNVNVYPYGIRELKKIANLDTKKEGKNKVIALKHLKKTNKFVSIRQREVG